MTAALVLAAATAPTPAAGNIWGDLMEMDRKKAAVDARLEDSLSDFKNMTRAKVEAGLDGLEGKVKVDKEAMGKGLAIKLANLTAAKEALSEGAAKMKVEANEKWWAAFNKTGGLEGKAKLTIAALSNKTESAAGAAAAKVGALKEGAEKASDAAKEALEAHAGEASQKAADKTKLVAEKVANATVAVGEKVEVVAAGKGAKLNATAAATAEKLAALDAWKDGLTNHTAEKLAALDGKVNATLATKDAQHGEVTAALEAKADALTAELAALEAAKDGAQVKVVGAGAGKARSAPDAGKAADVRAKLEAVEAELDAQPKAAVALVEGAADKAALKAGHQTDLGAAASSLKLPSLKRGVPGGVGNAFFAAPGEPAPEAAGDAAADATPAAAPVDVAAPTSGSGVSAAVGAGGPPAATAAFQVELPKTTMADWTPSKQVAFVGAVAAWAKVPVEAVTIQGVSSAGGVVDTAVDFADEAAAAGFARRLASDGAGLAAATAAAGLGAARPTEVQVAGADATGGGPAGAAAGGGASSKSTGLSPGAIAGITVGSAAGAALLAAAVGTGIAVSRKRQGAGGTPLTGV